MCSYIFYVILLETLLKMQNCCMNFTVNSHIPTTQLL